MTPFPPEIPECVLYLEVVEQLRSSVERIEALVGDDHRADWWVSAEMIDLMETKSESGQDVEVLQERLAARETSRS